MVLAMHDYLTAEVSPSAELAALGRLTANWRSLTEGMGPLLSGKGGTK